MEADSDIQTKNYLWSDPARCIGCYSCEVACMLEHDLPPGPRPIRIIQIGPLEHKDGLVMTFQPASCLHCQAPACVEACPTGAMRKRVDGLVLSDPDLCIGCQTCAIACPFGVPMLNPSKGKISKCDGCAARVDQGLTPACVLTCPTEALSFMNPVMKSQRARERFSLGIRQLKPKR
jgi:Fe-S-cluster-containing dehydrogenase component